MVPLIIIFLMFYNATQGQYEKGLGQFPSPDVIRCGNIFYYIQFSSETENHYYAFDGSPKFVI